MYRRSFVQKILGSSFLVALAGYKPSAFSRVMPGKETLSALPAFLDVLLPEDGSPSATQLGIDQQLYSHAAAIENYPWLLQLGCQWLDQQAFTAADVSFRQLSPETMDEIVRRAEMSPETSVQKLFFERVKSDTFTFYYGHPASWGAIGFSGPIQPLGFPDFSVPPNVKL